MNPLPGSYHYHTRGISILNLRFLFRSTLVIFTAWRDCPPVFRRHSSCVGMSTEIFFNLPVARLARTSFAEFRGEQNNYFDGVTIRSKRADRCRAREINGKIIRITNDCDRNSLLSGLYGPSGSQLVARAVF